jgi:hypothetical protein
MHSKGVVIIYGEGGVGKWGKIRIENFFDPPPDRRQTFCASPLIKVETFLTPPSVDWKINSNETGVRCR